MSVNKHNMPRFTRAWPRPQPAVMLDDGLHEDRFPIHPRVDCRIVESRRPRPATSVAGAMANALRRPTA